MDCHFRDLPDIQSSEARLMTASAVHKLSEYFLNFLDYFISYGLSSSEFARFPWVSRHDDKLMANPENDSP